MKAASFNPEVVKKAWGALQASLGPLGPIRSEAQYSRMRKVLDELVDLVGGRERHALAGLLDMVGELVEDYEAREVPIPESTPAEALRFLMESNKLSQVDLKTELGGQPVVSAILSGKRGINGRQARALADRFGVSPAVFI